MAGVPLEEAVYQAKDGREVILQNMLSVINETELKLTRTHHVSSQSRLTQTRSECSSDLVVRTSKRSRLSLVLTSTSKIAHSPHL